MSAARSDLCDVSPISQRSASTRFDLPQPFGPTTPVRPGSMRKSVGSTKDLKPSRRSRVSFMPALFRNCRGRPERIAQGSGPWCGSRNAASNRRMNRQPRLRNRKNELCICGSGLQGADGLPRTQIRSTDESEKPLSALEIGGELLVQLLSGEPAADDLAVDEKSGRRIHSELCRRSIAACFNAGKYLLIRETFLKALLGKPCLLRDRQHRLQWLMHHPVPLLREQRFNQGEVLVLARTSGQHGTGCGELVERELAEDEANLAGIDVLGLQLRIGRLVEMGAVRAGHGCILDDRHRGIRGAENVVTERTRRHEFRYRHITPGIRL